MGIDITEIEREGRQAVRSFWLSRQTAQERQAKSGREDQGERSGVTAGKNMDGFLDLLMGVVETNGLTGAGVHTQRVVLTLPGYFRPTKLWDLLVTYKGELVAAIELKSQVGPSFGNNLNNRAEEAIGTGHDLCVAYREGAFGAQPRPFVGWLMLAEDCPASRRSVRCSSPHFPVLPEFRDASYLTRYSLLCEKLMHEQLYSAAALIASPRTAISSGDYTELSPMTGLKTFVACLAGHVAATSARMQ